MATAVIMPRQGQSVESCIITEWKKKTGDTVKEGDILFSYETDKSSFDEPAAVSGTLLAVFAEEGDDVPCLETVCIIGEAGEDFSALMPAGSGEQQPAPAESKDMEQQPESPAAAVTSAVPTERMQQTAASGGKLKISPRAKNLAERTGADVLKAFPTGPEGRIIERDIHAVLDRGQTVSSAALGEYLAAGRPAAGTGAGGRVLLEDLGGKPETESAPAAGSTGAEDFAGFEEEKLSNIRKVIAKSMHASLSEMAQLTLNASFDATQILQYRALLKARAEAMGITNITLNDMVLYAVSRTLPAHRALNAHYTGESMRYFKHVNLGVAVDTEKGLLVPTVFGADTLSLDELARASKALITAAQKGNIDPDLLRGGTFTVTNLGSLGVESFTPVINPPQTAILGVNAITQRAREAAAAEGGIEFYPAMGLSLTFDHRALDGAPAARFLQQLCRNLENFSLLLSL